MTNSEKENISKAISAGSDYLRNKVLSGKYGLSCLGNDGSPKFSNSKGHLFSLFHIVNALKDEINEIERTIFLMRILSEEYEGAWGYSPRGYYRQEGYNPFFVDSDDTSFALRTLRALDVYRSNDVLMKFKSTFSYDAREYDGFSTFITNHQNRELSSTPSFENNFKIHPEVNANVFHALLNSNYDHLINENLIKFSQNDDGSWASFFYPNPYYATWQFMSLLQEKGIVQSCFDRGINFLVEKQNKNGSWGEMEDTYYTALSINTLSLNKNNTEQINKAVNFLLAKQEENGSWKTSNIIWQFHDQEGDTWSAFDVNAVISSSACVEALKNYLTHNE